VLGSWTRGVIVNRTVKVANLTTSEVEQFMGRTLGSMLIIAEISEGQVQEAEREGVPVVMYELE
jgi:hypothetical protein